MLVQNIATVDRRLLLVAPLFASVPDTFRRLTRDGVRHRGLVAEIQRLRGAVYLADGYILPHQLSSDGRHQTIEDIQSWHLLVLDARGAASGCAWYLKHENTISIRHLRVRHCPLACSGWRGRLHGAVETEIGRARRDGLHYAELGGWAVSAARRSTTDGLLLALGAYALSRILGGALGITAANVAHGSAAILRRLGGADLNFRGTRMPAHFDPRYNATVELLRFDSREPSARYRRLVDMLTLAFSNVAVIAAQTHAHVDDTRQNWFANGGWLSSRPEPMSPAVQAARP